MTVASGEYVFDFVEGEGGVLTEGFEDGLVVWDTEF